MRELYKIKYIRTSNEDSNQRSLNAIVTKQTLYKIAFIPWIIIISKQRIEFGHPTKILM